MLGVEFNKKEIRNDVIQRLFKNKLLVIPSGVKTIRIFPPLVITDEEISKGLDIFEKVLKEINH
jgi:4-aminobutyrate aminotransferase-like enzyme